MSATTTSETWDAAWTLTRRKTRSGVSDIVFDEYPVLDFMRKRGRVEISRGGKEFKENVMYAKNSGTWFSGYDTVNTAAVDGITAAFFPPRYFSTPVTISLTEQTENEGAEDGASLIETKQKQSDMTVMDSISASLLGSAGSKQMLGFQDIIADSPSTGTVGGIDRSVVTGWRNQANTTSTGFLTQTATNVFDGFDQMTQTRNDCSSGNDAPDLVVCPLDIYSDIQTARMSQGYTDLVSGGSKASSQSDLGTMPWMGAQIIAERDCAADHIYLINTKYLKLKIMADLNFAKTPFRENTDQHAKVAHVVFGGQLVTNNPRRLGVLTDVT